MILTRINIGLSALLSGLLLCASCSEEVSVDDSFGESVPLGVSSLRLDGELATRAGGTPVTAEGTTIKVFFTNVGGYTSMYNKTYTCSSGKWSSTDPVYVDKRTGKVVGVYDPNSLVSFGTNSTITTNTLQAQASDEKKLWYYDNTTGASVNSTNAVLAFSMKPAYSRLSFSISRHANYPLACKVSQIVIKPSSGNFYTNARVNIADGSLTGTAVANYTINTSAMSMNTAGIAAGATDTSVDHLFPAQTCNGLTITLTIDGVNRAITVPAAQFSNNLTAGQQYTISLIIIDAEIVLPASAVTVNDWSSVSNQDTDAGF